MDDIFDGDDAKLAKVGFDEGVVSERDALLVDLSISALVDQFTDSLEVWLAVSDVWLNVLQHLASGLCDLEEDTVVDLEETEELEDLSWLWCNLVDTLDTDDKEKLGLSWDVKVAFGLCDTAEADFLALAFAVLADVLVSTLEDDLALCLCGLMISIVLSTVDQPRKMVNDGQHCLVTSHLL